MSSLTACVKIRITNYIYPQLQATN
jgi:ABC-type uncharacterized transport system fused permease/ATPase subunit